RGTVRSKRMFQRTTIARLSIGLVLGLVLAVVLHQSNTRDPNLYSNLLSQGAFGGTASASADIITSTAPVTSAASCPMGTAWSHGGCNEPCVEVPQVWPDCPGGMDNEQQCEESYSEMGCESSASSVYCCYGEGQPNNCTAMASPGNCGEGTTGEYNDLASCTASCPINGSSSSCNAVGEVCGGGYGDCCAPAFCDNVSDYGYCVTSSAASSVDPTQWCCYQGGCSAFIPSSAP
ncbi:MAG TPA: hypothetical protein PKV72_03950, partial [Candidatus Peribacteria bacterium]|nr:hypothetical protein [Candidatus Peribacteria bacterium]